MGYSARRGFTNGKVSGAQRQAEMQQKIQQMQQQMQIICLLCLLWRMMAMLPIVLRQKYL